MLSFLFDDWSPAFSGKFDSHFWVLLVRLQFPVWGQLWRGVKESTVEDCACYPFDPGGMLVWDKSQCSRIILNRSSDGFKRCRVIDASLFPDSWSILNHLIGLCLGVGIRRYKWCDFLDSMHLSIVQFVTTCDVRCSHCEVARFRGLLEVPLLGAFLVQVSTCVVIFKSNHVDGGVFDNYSISSF